LGAGVLSKEYGLRRDDCKSPVRSGPEEKKRCQRAAGARCDMFKLKRLQDAPGRLSCGVKPADSVTYLEYTENSLEDQE
jgi:hypothetical protein